MNGIETRFKIGNKDAEKYDIATAIALFEKVLYNALCDENVLCVQDAFFSVDLLPSTAYYLTSKFAELDNIKKDINDIIISRINSKALNNKFNATASIWRFKQLGEKDERSLDMTSTDGTMSPTKIEFYKTDENK